MRNNTIYHPLFATHPRNSLYTGMTDRVEILRPTDVRSEAWSLNGGIVTPAFVPVYIGRARVQPNIDWRARDREHAGELNSTIAARIQIPIGENEFGATYDDDGELVSYGPDPIISKNFKVHVLSSESDASPGLPEYEFIVRNALQASKKWLYTFLADTGTKLDV